MKLLVAAQRLGALAFATAAVTTCANSGEPAASNVIREIRAGAETVALDRSYASIVEAMPSPSERADRYASNDRSQLVALGQFVGAEPGVGASWSEDGSEDFFYEYGSDESVMSTVHLRFKIDEVVAAGAGLVLDGAAGSEFTVTLWVEGAPSLDSVAAEMSALGNVVIFASRGETHYSDADVATSNVTDGLWSILESGAFLATVDEAESLRFPAMDSFSQEELRADSLTVDDLREAAKG